MDIYSVLKKFYLYFQDKKRRMYIDKLIKKGLRIGKNVDIVDTFFLDPSHCFLIAIGDGCTICPNVRFLAHDASTKKNLGFTKIGKIEIEENCFIGDSAILLPGVTIGANSIVGAGAVVTRDVPPNVIVAGNPARQLFSIQEYLTRIEALSKGKRIFGKEYHIKNLTPQKCKEILESVGDDIGFIV